MTQPSTRIFFPSINWPGKTRWCIKAANESLYFSSASNLDAALLDFYAFCVNPTTPRVPLGLVLLAVERDHENDEQVRIVYLEAVARHLWKDDALANDAKRICHERIGHRA